jgi:hypothetical protein
MSNLCLDEGTLQSYYDGQLSTRSLETVNMHLASCVSCAEAARWVGSEMEMIDGAFAAELSLSVPSDRLRSGLDAAIAGVGSPTLVNESVFSRARAWLEAFGTSSRLAPQRTIGYASILVFFVLAAVVGGIIMRQRESGFGTEIVAGNSGVPRDLIALGPSPTITTPVRDNFDVQLAQRRSASRRTVHSRVAALSGNNEISLAHRPLPGEKNYLQAISLLTDAIETNGETSLKPTLLADYKRNLEVVNEAIKVTQRTARTNPESSDASEMLFAIYQSKIDLLSAIAEESRPMLARR